VWRRRRKSGGPGFVGPDLVEFIGPEMARGANGTCDGMGKRARAGP